MGRQINGKVYCNDGWTDSMVDYDFMAICKNNKPSCSIEDWNGLKSKYDIDGLYNRMQDITDKMSDNVLGAFDLSLANLLQIKYNALKSQYDSVYSNAIIQCSVLGSIEADERRIRDIEIEKTKSDYYNAQIKANEEIIARLKEEQRKSMEYYQHAINKLEVPPIQSSPPSAPIEPPTKTINSSLTDTISTNGVQTVKEWLKTQPLPKQKEEQKKATLTLIRQEVKKDITIPSDKTIEGKNTTRKGQSPFSRAFDSIKSFFSTIFK